jgi:hypothetical protein
VAARVYIVTFRTHDDRRPSKFIVLADGMKSAIKIARDHGGGLSIALRQVDGASTGDERSGATGLVRLLTLILHLLFKLLKLVKLTGQFVKLVYDFLVASLDILVGELIHLLLDLFACHWCSLILPEGRSSKNDRKSRSLRRATFDVPS